MRSNISRRLTQLKRRPAVSLKPGEAWDRGPGETDEDIRGRVRKSLLDTTSWPSLEFGSTFLVASSSARYSGPSVFCNSFIF